MSTKHPRRAVQRKQTRGPLSRIPSERQRDHLTYVVEKLVTVRIASSYNEDHNGYLKSKWLQSIGRQVFENGKTMVTVTHLGKLPPQRGGTGLDHWVLLAINGLDHIFFYGDSLRRKETPTLPLTLLKTLNAWKGIHTSVTER
ncbi:hypothetical protein F5890DRAFT_1476857 [Lentinula detonsa]|uniref:Cysteine proteinase n=1 Tax=Lentinula detonsa TaxID=2804962 RepID=A0AA38PTQ5_9AGAR|nr:hypothetical protein F5890DRAFT_1476857 [Lentinula detonsa]